MEDLTDANICELSQIAATEVIAKTQTSLTVLQNLGPYLTDKNLGKRKIGLNFLSQFLSQLPPDFCDFQECEVFAKFYEDRVNDHHSLIPAIICGIEAIIKFDNLRRQNQNALIRQFFTQIHVQSQILHDRRRVFSIFQLLLTTDWKLQCLKDLGSEFVLIFIQAVDAEKDPQNMKMIFSLWPIILNEFKLEPFEEDIFEAMSCYFPIDFSPPKGTEIIVSKDDLVLGLRKSLSTSGIFAPLALPLFMEKLDSEISDAKIDANLTLIQCLKVYVPEQLQLHLESLWELLKKEILGIRMNTNEEVILTSHQVIHHVTLTLASADPTTENSEILEKWLNMIWNDTGRHLKDIELKFMSLSVEILVDVIGTQKEIPSAFMLEKAMPILLQIFSQSEAKKASILHFIGRLLKDSAKPKTSNQSWYENYLYVCLEALTSSDLKLQTAAATTLTSGGHFLAEVNATQIFDQIKYSEFYELINTCLEQSGGSRPTDEDLQVMHDRKLSRSLAVMYKNVGKFEENLPKICDQINENYILEMLKIVISDHKVIKNEILKKLLNTLFEATNPQKCDILALLAPKLDEEFVYVFDQILDHDQNVQKSVICNSDQNLINKVSKNQLKTIFDQKEPMINASLINKIGHPEDLLDQLDENDQKDQLLIMITKGLLFRQKPYPKVRNWLIKVIKIIENDHLDFRQLITPDHLQIDHSRINLIRQKIFALTKPILVKNFEQNINPIGHLEALIIQLPHVPKFALSSEMSELLPLLLKALNEDFQESNMKLASLGCLTDLLDLEPEKFGPYLATFVPLWMKLSQDKKQDLKVRIKALECVKMSAKSEGTLVTLMKKEVVKSLTPALDDHKRLVRQMAVQARNSWCLA